MNWIEDEEETEKGNTTQIVQRVQSRKAMEENGHPDGCSNAQPGSQKKHRNENNKEKSVITLNIIIIFIITINYSTFKSFSHSLAMTMTPYYMSSPHRGE